MQIKNKKIPMIVYISLLAIMIPITGFSIYLHYEGYGIGVERDTNVNKLFKYEGKLYFYDEGKLVGKYVCQTTECDYAYETLDDDKYNLDYYDDEKIDQLVGLINHRYAFITDGSDTIMLYDAASESVFSEFKAVKNYSIGLEDNHYITMLDNNLWGVLDLGSELPTRTVSYQYQYIGVQNEIANDSNSLVSDMFVGFDGTNWKIINTGDIIISVDFDESIYKYDNNTIVTVDNDIYRVRDYNGKLLISNEYKYANYIDHFLLLVDFENTVHTYDIKDGFITSRGIVLDVSSIEIQNGKDVYYDGELQFTL